jgi:hypothetical protein
MTPATAHFASITAIANAIKTQLTAIQLPDKSGPLFQRVELFDSENLLEAFQLLLISEQRLALIVPLDAHWETESSQRKLLTRRSLPVDILVSDRVLGNRTAALYGDDNNLGAFALAALAVPSVSGQLLPNPSGVVSYPVNESVLIVKNKADKQNLPGRAAIAIELECKGGWLEAPLGAGPTL